MAGTTLSIDPKPLARLNYLLQFVAKRAANLAGTSSSFIVTTDEVIYYTKPSAGTIAALKNRNDFQITNATTSPGSFTCHCENDGQPMEQNFAGTNVKVKFGDTIQFDLSVDSVNGAAQFTNISGLVLSVPPPLPDININTMGANWMTNKVTFDAS